MPLGSTAASWPDSAGQVFEEPHSEMPQRPTGPQRSLLWGAPPGVSSSLLSALDTMGLYCPLWGDDPAWRVGHQTTQEKPKEAARHGSPGPRLPGERNGVGLLERKLAIRTMAGSVPLFTSKELVSGKVISKEQLKQFTLNQPTCLTEQGAPACPVWCRMGYGSQSRTKPETLLSNPAARPSPAWGESAGRPGRRGRCFRAHARAECFQGLGSGPSFILKRSRFHEDRSQES